MSDTAQHPLKNPPTVLILASGRGERFLASGGTTHKLAASLGEGLYKKTVLQHTVDAVKASGLPYHVEDAGHPGMGDSIAAAVRQTQHANGWLVLPADLPLVQPETLLRVAEALQVNVVVQPVFQQDAEQGAEQLRGHPVGFGRVCLDKLLKLEGNKGAAGVLLTYTAIKLVVYDVGIITDIDTVEDLARADAILKNRSFTISAGF
jgi:molybdenum cofactor cytidylyltransferase